MDLITSAVLVSLGIFFFASIPWLLSNVRQLAKPLLFVGTAILVTVFFFEILPEMYEEMGVMCLLIMVSVWAVQYLSHGLRYGFGSHSHGEGEKAATALVASMSLHCVAGGLFLVSSFEISAELAEHVFHGLIGHKGFEAMSISAMLILKVPTKKKLVTLLAIYSLSFPLAVVVAFGAKVAFAQYLSQEVMHVIAGVVGSVAMGSLLGCLVHHFLIPSAKEAYSLAKGLALTGANGRTQK